MKALLVFVFVLAFALPVHPGEVVRSHSQLRAFARQHACPATGLNKLPCPGYVIDHIVPLDCGGKDRPSNMQWQTIEDGQAKDLCERNGPRCRHRTHGPTAGCEKH